MAAPRKRSAVVEQPEVVEPEVVEPEVVEPEVVEEPEEPEAVRVTPEQPLPKQQSEHTVQAPPADVVTPNNPPAKAQ